MPSRIALPSGLGRVSAALVLFAAVVAAGCAPAPIYRSHHQDSSGGEARITEPADQAGVDGLTLIAPLDRLTATRIISRFGPRQTNGGPGSANHQGVDIKARPQEPVRAAAPGIVAFSGRQSGYGNLIILDHGNGFKTYYAHLFSASVKRGDRVAGGQTIGLAGKGGRATTTHLHFEVRRGARPVDPMPYLMACLRRA